MQFDRWTALLEHWWQRCTPDAASATLRDAVERDGLFVSPDLAEVRAAGAGGGGPALMRADGTVVVVQRNGILASVAYPSGSPPSCLGGRSTQVPRGAYGTACAGNRSAAWDARGWILAADEATMEALDGSKVRAIGWPGNDSPLWINSRGQLCEGAGCLSDQTDFAALTVAPGWAAVTGGTEVRLLARTTGCSADLVLAGGTGWTEEVALFSDGGRSAKVVLRVDNALLLQTATCEAGQIRLIDPVRLSTTSHVSAIEWGRAGEYLIWGWGGLGVEVQDLSAFHKGATSCVPRRRYSTPSTPAGVGVDEQNKLAWAWGSAGGSPWLRVWDLELDPIRPGKDGCGAGAPEPDPRAEEARWTAALTAAKAHLTDLEGLPNGCTPPSAPSPAPAPAPAGGRSP